MVVTGRFTQRRRRRHRWAFRAIVGLGAVAMLAACTGNPSGETTATTLRPIATGIIGSTTAAPTTPPSTTEPQPGWSLEDTAPLNDRGFRFELVEGDAAGSTVPIGLVELPQIDPTAATGRCFALLGTYTGVRAESLLVSQNVLARAELVTDGAPSTGDDNISCDRASLGNAGWGSRVDARLLPGADFNFATVFFVPSPANLRAIRLFGTEPNEQRFYDAGVLPTIPALPPVRAGSAPLNLTASDATAVNPLTIGDSFQTVKATVSGVVPGFPRTDGLPGSCVAVIGTMKPTRTIGAIVNSLALPEVGLIADGTALQPSPDRCAARQLATNGWLDLRYAGVASDNTFAFAELFAVSSDGPILQAIGLGDLYDAETRELLTAILLDDSPEAPRREGVNPDVPLRPNVEDVSTPVGTGTASSVPPTPVSSEPPSTPPSAPPTTSDSSDPTGSDPTGTDGADTTAAPTTQPPANTVNTYTVSGSPVITIVNEAVWNAQAYGIVTLPSNAEAATCYAILMTWSVSQGSPTDPPPVGLLSSGAYWAPTQTEAQCDLSSLTNSGWQDATQANFNDVDAAPMHVFVAMFIPDGQDRFGAIGIGNVADDTNVGYVAPVRIAAPPPIPGIVPTTSPPTDTASTTADSSPQQ